MSAARASAARLLAGAATAASFLTVIPIRLPVATERKGVEWSAAWFPLVGALLGGLAGGVRVGAEPLFGATVASVLALVVLVGATGALHLDGLADSADALGAGGDRQRRLKIMRDSAIGTFGVLALVAWALLFLAVIASLDDVDALRALLTAAALGRWAALVHAAATPAARPDGLGAAFSPAPAPVAIASVLAVVIAALASGPGPSLAALAAAALCAALSALWARRFLGGRTGDTLGATIALTEVVACLPLLAIWLT
jgi:adenosylcobinamide-GDP ribazoletransferase